jgi:hypothetical protein
MLGVGSVRRDPLDAARSRAVVAGYSGCSVETGLGGACPTSRALLAPVMPARTDRASKANTIVFIGCGSICKHDPDNTHCCSSLAPTWAPGPSPRCAAGHSSAQSGATYCDPCPIAGHRRDRGAAAELASQGLGTPYHLRPQSNGPVCRGQPTTPGSALQPCLLGCRPGPCPIRPRIDPRLRPSRVTPCPKRTVDDRVWDRGAGQGLVETSAGSPLRPRPTQEACPRTTAGNYNHERD